MTETTDGGVVSPPGEGQTTRLFGDTYTVKAAGGETGGSLAVIEADLAPHSGGTPLHVNTLEAENYYVTEGTLTFRLGERTVEAPAGTFVHIPKGLVHTHWNAGGASVKLVAFPAPAGLQTFFADLAELMAEMPPGPPDMGKIAAFYERYGLRVVGGHDHDYERFASQRLDDIRDDSRGLRQSVAGTGGGTQHAFGEIQPNSQARNASTPGVLKLTLNSGSYEWKFVPVAGKTFTDSGTTSCH